MIKRPIRYALRWCRGCQNPVATGSRCHCPKPDEHVPVLIKDATIGERVQFGPYAHVYGSMIGDESRIGAFVEVQRGVVIGNRCKVSSHSFLCTGVTLDDGVFVGHGVYFCNDRRPRAVNPDGLPTGDGDWTLEGVAVKRGASIGTGSIVLPGVTIGEEAVVGAGTVVTRDVAARTIMRTSFSYAIKGRAS